MDAAPAEEAYIPRIADAQIAAYLETFGAVEVAGTKWCGKTWSSLKHGKSVSFVDEELDLAHADPNMMLIGERPHVIDEWQECPRIWDAVRHEVDLGASATGQFILTGSASPLAGPRKGPVHSGAGRFGRVRMFPMSLLESGESTGAVSLAGLFDGEFEPCKIENDTRSLVEAACRGGWPALVAGKQKNPQLLVHNYIDYSCSRSIPKLGLNEDTALRLLRSLSRNLCQSATRKTLISDMYGTDAASMLSEKTLSKYLAALKSMYLIEEISGWTPQARSKRRMMTKAKRYFADPSLPCAFLNMSAERLLSDWQTFGLVFENMAMRDLMAYSQSLPHFGEHPVKYYRDDSGLECDAILELADGRWAAIEIKTSEDKVEGACENLLRLKTKLCGNQKAATPAPSFMAVIVGVGSYTRKTTDGIYVVPLRALAP